MAESGEFCTVATSLPRWYFFSSWQFSIYFNKITDTIKFYSNSHHSQISLPATTSHLANHDICNFFNDLSVSDSSFSEEKYKYS